MNFTPQIDFQFDYRKTTQAASILARLAPRETISRMRLLKLLYIADREALKEIGRSITGDQLTAMRKGPVISEFYNMIKGESVHSATFDKYFECIGHQVVVRKPNTNSHLNRYEIRKLHEVSDRFREFDDDDLSEFTHKFPEWEKNKPPGNSSRPISVEDVLEAFGQAEKVELVRRKASLKKAVDVLWD